jgi:hypothetical protein
MVMGLEGALFEAIKFDGGQIKNASISKYRLPRFSELPEIKVVLLDRKGVPSAGASEMPIVGIAPASRRPSATRSSRRLAFDYARCRWHRRASRSDLKFSDKSPHSKFVYLFLFVFTAIRRRFRHSKPKDHLVGQLRKIRRVFGGVGVGGPINDDHIVQAFDTQGLTVAGVEGLAWQELRYELIHPFGIVAVLAAVGFDGQSGVGCLPEESIRQVVVERFYLSRFNEVRAENARHGILGGKAQVGPS